MTDYSKRHNLKLNPILRSVQKEEEEFKRPDHPDFQTTAELKKAVFSGVRQNEITREWEFWILGEIKRTVHESVATPEKLAETHFDLFDLRKSER